MRNQTDSQINTEYISNSDQPTYGRTNGNVAVHSKRKSRRDQVKEFNSRFEASHPDDILSWGHEKFGSDMVLGTGFGPSGVFLIHSLVTQKLPVKIFYLDTHLLFRETYSLRDELEERFGISIERISTELSLDEQADKHGSELWKTDPDRCCYLRKVLPLKNYLSDKKAWVTGVRRNQAATRNQTEVIEWDPLNEVVKINPLAKWSNEDVWEYIHKHNLPYNPLHDHGYPTIGCIPCTEPVEKQEHERNGRWKDNEKTECGIHLPSQNYQNGNRNNKS